MDREAVDMVDTDGTQQVSTERRRQSRPLLGLRTRTRRHLSLTVRRAHRLPIYGSWVVGIDCGSATECGVGAGGASQWFVSVAKIQGAVW